MKSSHITIATMVISVCFVFAAPAQELQQDPTPTAPATPSPVSSIEAPDKAPPRAVSWEQQIGRSVWFVCATTKRWLMSDRSSVTPTNLLRIGNVLAAMLIGTLGALAFYAGVKFGFISPESRKNLLLYLPTDRIARASRNYFYMLGGIVAAIFQWAQPDVLAPIQAFVLGATWPSVVTRIMSGAGSIPSVPTVDTIIKESPAAGTPADDAVVVIKPRAT